MARESEDQNTRSQDGGSIDPGRRLQKKVILHLKEYDTAPLNCTVSFMALRLGEDRKAVYDAVQELLYKGVISEWDQWKRGAVTPYRLQSLSKLIDQGMDLTYEEVYLLTEPQGGFHRDVPLTVAGGLGGVKGYMLSTWAKENLREISLGMRRIGIAEGVAPKRKPPGLESGEDLAHDLELGYLNIFFRAQFFADEIDPLYILYSKRGEDLEAFRKRTINRLLQVMAQMSKNLLVKMEKKGIPSGAYAYFFASMLSRYVKLARESGIESEEPDRLADLRDEILARAGEAR